MSIKLKLNKLCPECKEWFVAKGKGARRRKICYNPECRKQYMQDYGRRVREGKNIREGPRYGANKGTEYKRPKKTVYNLQSLRELPPEKLAQVINEMGR